MRDTRKALLWILEILEKHKMKYRVSGGFAARLYGSTRKLADIDIELPRGSIKKIIPGIRKHIVHGPNGYKDKEWDCYAVELVYKSQEIGLAEINRIFDKRERKWVPFKASFNKNPRLKVYGKIINIIRKEELIAYKNKIRRSVDLQDIEFLKKEI